LYWLLAKKNAYEYLTLKCPEFPSNHVHKEQSLSHQLSLIRESAFENCRFKTFAILRSVRVIESAVFRGSFRLWSITFISDLQFEQIKVFTFSDTTLTELTLPSKLMEFVGSAVEQLTHISVMQNHSFMVIESFLIKAEGSDCDCESIWRRDCT
jgi:hypothetical protein